jgi:hypothetical protein
MVSKAIKNTTIEERQPYRNALLANDGAGHCKSGRIVALPFRVRYALIERSRKQIKNSSLSPLACNTSTETSRP